MRKVLFLLGIIVGAVILNSSDTYGLNVSDFKEKVFGHNFEIREVDEDTFQNRTNSLSKKVGTKIDLGNYPCSENKTSYFFNDVCLDNDDLQEIMMKVISNVTPDELESVVEELQAY